MASSFAAAAARDRPEILVIAPERAPAGAAGIWGPSQGRPAGAFSGNGVESFTALHRTDVLRGSYQKTGPAGKGNFVKTS